MLNVTETVATPELFVLPIDTEVEVETSNRVSETPDTGLLCESRAVAVKITEFPVDMLVLFADRFIDATLTGGGVGGGEGGGIDRATATPTPPAITAAITPPAMSPLFAMFHLRALAASRHIPR